MRIECSAAAAVMCACCPQAEDSTTPASQSDVDRMLAELKTRWTAVCARSVDRQKALEDSLLVAGQFKDALALLLDWLYRVEPSLSDELPVCGDRDTVYSLIEAHKVSLVHDVIKSLRLTKYITKYFV